MNTTVLITAAKAVAKKLPKILVTVGGIGVSLASDYYAKKELDALVSKKVAEEVAKITQNN